MRRTSNSLNRKKTVAHPHPYSPHFVSHGPAPRDAHNQAIPHQEEEPFHVEVKLEEDEGHAVDVIHGKGGEHQTHVVEEEEEESVYHPPPPPPPPPPVHHEVVSSWEEAEEVRLGLGMVNG